MSRGGIRLHPKHGVNPTMPLCNWCGKPTGEVALLGVAYNGRAPKHMVVNDTPCATCREGMAQGITFIERKSETDKERTGRWCVLKEEAVRRLVKNPDLLASILEKRAANITPAVSKELGLFDVEGS